MARSLQVLDLRRIGDMGSLVANIGPARTNRRNVQVVISNLAPTGSLLAYMVRVKEDGLLPTKGFVV